MASIDVLLPTCNRLPSLAMTLGGLATQTISDMRVIVADQSAEAVADDPVVQTLGRVIEERGGAVEWHHREPVHGIAEQRDFLLRQAIADAILYLDDDVLMEPWVLEQLLEILRAEECAFVGAFPAGLSHRHDVRPEQQRIEYWDGPVHPEIVEPESEQWERWQLHRAANLYHVAQSLPRGEVRQYKVAWIASCILYDRQKLESVGGFSFWSRLPRYHSGEEVLVQNLLMRRWGGCGVVPSATYYSQVPTTVLNDAGTVDGHALDLLPEMVRRYVDEGDG
ncbi:MAG TPA: glycosyltransferase family A protein [Thermomicrobiales bacterium]|nr:glycosyltransferase family A protein [Thermomicrobiales bacterium]